MKLGIDKALADGNGNTLIYTALIGAVLSQCLPNPGDAVFFWRQDVDKSKLDKGEITVKQYWIRDAVGYYGFSAGYYILVLGTVMAMGGSYKNKSRLLMGLVAGGLVVGVVAKNIQKDSQVKKA